MKVWELQEGKVYKGNRENLYKLENGKYKIKLGGRWQESSLSINTFVDMYFKEVIGTNNHWKSMGDEYSCYIRADFSGVLKFLLKGEDGRVCPKSDANIFHINDKKKAECLALEFKIKSVLLNWRRLHDDVELNWENSTWKYYISYDCWYDRIEFFSRSTFISHFFGYFSSDKKAKEFYEYMKDYIHR